MPKKRNEQAINIQVWEPLLTSWLQYNATTKSGFIQRVGTIFTDPGSVLNEVLASVGLPLFRQANGGNDASQTRQISITDLQTRVLEVERQKREYTQQIAEKVILLVLDFDQTRREFQISQEIAKREVLRQELRTVAYRLGEGTTDSYLSQLTSLDQQKANSFRGWAKVRAGLARIKLLVFGVQD